MQILPILLQTLQILLLLFIAYMVAVLVTCGARILARLTGTPPPGQNPPKISGFVIQNQHGGYDWSDEDAQRIAAAIQKALREELGEFGPVEYKPAPPAPDTAARNRLREEIRAAMESLPKGATGADGHPGPPGMAIRHGSGPPEDSTDETVKAALYGEYYLDTANDNLYTMLTGGYMFIGNVKPNRTHPEGTDGPSGSSSGPGYAGKPYATGGAVHPTEPRVVGDTRPEPFPYDRPRPGFGGKSDPDPDFRKQVREEAALAEARGDVPTMPLEPGEYNSGSHA